MTQLITSATVDKGGFLIVIDHGWAALALKRQMRFSLIGVCNIGDKAAKPFDDLRSHLGVKRSQGTLHDCRCRNDIVFGASGNLSHGQHGSFLRCGLSRYEILHPQQNISRHRNGVD